MKFNDKELCNLSKSPADLEGRLSFRKTTSTTTMISSSKAKSGFKDRWFKLKYNLLFYFKTNDIGQIDDSQPDGVFVLENASIHQESSAGVPFAFSIIFKDDTDKKYVMSTRSEQDVITWMTALKKVSYEYLRSQLVILQDKIRTLTGRDPLLLVPRNKPILYSTTSSHQTEDNYSFHSYNVDFNVTHTVSQKSHKSSHRTHTSSEFYTSSDLFPPVPVANLIDL